MSDPNRKCLLGDPNLGTCLRILGLFIILGILIACVLAWIYIP
jgi:hypothetical protein